MALRRERSTAFSTVVSPASRGPTPTLSDLSSLRCSLGSCWRVTPLTSSAGDGCQSLLDVWAAAWMCRSDCETREWWCWLCERVSVRAKVLQYFIYFLRENYLKVPEKF